jgi:hypothetical protein
LKRVRDSIGKPVLSNSVQDFGVGQDIYCASDQQRRKPLSINPDRFPFVNERQRSVCDRKSDSSGFTVIQRLGGRSNNQRFKMLLGCVIKLDYV